MAKSKKEESKSIDISKHILVPKHVKLSDKEKKDLFRSYRISISDLPRISMKDPALSRMELTTKDVIKIVRPSRTAGTSLFYRRVVK